MIHLFTAPKHGIGTTTTAAMFAALLVHDENRSVLYVDGSQQQDADAVLGIAAHQGIDVRPITDRFSFVAVPEYWAWSNDSHSKDQLIEWATEWTDIVIDVGRPTHELSNFCHPKVYSVVDLSYVTLRAAVQDRTKPDYLIVIKQEGRSLRTTDVEQALGRKVDACIPHDPAIARLVDAGLLVSHKNVVYHSDLARLISSTVS